MFQILILFIAVVILGTIILWSKKQEKRRGYYSYYKQTTDRGKAPIKMRSIQFTKNAEWKIKQWNLSEKLVLDTFYHGSVAKDYMLVRKYNGFEVGLYYKRDKHDGHYIITTCWKRKVQ